MQCNEPGGKEKIDSHKTHFLKHSDQHATLQQNKGYLHHKPLESESTLVHPTEMASTATQFSEVLATGDEGGHIDRRAFFQMAIEQKIETSGK